MTRRRLRRRSRRGSRPRGREWQHTLSRSEVICADDSVFVATSALFNDEDLEAPEMAESDEEEFDDDEDLDRDSDEESDDDEEVDDEFDLEGEDAEGVTLDDFEMTAAE